MTPKEKTLKILQENLQLTELRLRLLSEDMTPEEILVSEYLVEVKQRINDFKECIEWLQDEPLSPYSFTSVEKIEEIATNNLEDDITFPVLNNIEEAIDYVNNYITNPEDVKIETEHDFIVLSHHTIGQNLRNRLGLWSDENKPILVEYFNNHGITHPDDMSSIILTSYYRRLFDQPIELDKQVQHYKDYWEKQKLN